MSLSQKKIPPPNAGTMIRETAAGVYLRIP